MPYTLEVCVDSTASALAAKRGGADRLELCADLVIGGTTPSLALLRQVKAETGLPVRALLRPRFGDFCYDRYELAQMEQSAAELVEAGADDIVTGVLTPDGVLDVDALRPIYAAARRAAAAAGRPVACTLHRAFDVCRDPFAALAAAKELGLATILTSGQAASAQQGAELLRQLVPRGVDGVFLVVGDEFSDDRALREEVSHLPIPAVMVDRAIEGLECDKVMFDHEMGGYMATRYLIEQGHRRIACLVNARRSNTGRKRLAGYERALREVGLPIDARLEFESEYYIPSAYEASEAVLATDATAVFASSDNIALGLLKRLHEMGKSIPGDISVVSYDNSAADVLFEPALTAIEQDPGVLAEHAFGCMSKRLAGRGGRRAEEVVLEPALIVKGSVLELTKHN